MDKKIIKFDDTKTEEYKFHQNKSPISINKILNISLVTKILNKLHLYIYSVHK